MTFVNDDLDLVLFLNARNRIKFNCRDAVHRYIYRRRALYARKCNQEIVAETATQHKFKHILGLDKRRIWCDALSKPLKLQRDLIKHSTWSLAPNRYDVPMELYKSRKGAGGAHWAKVHKQKSLIEKKVDKRPRLNIVDDKKGPSWLFTQNVRDRRPTLRIMISSLQGCFKDPHEPGPTNYFPRHHQLEQNISPMIFSTPPNPHIFLRQSCVPAKTLSLVPRHISMDPAPGRYEIRYPYICGCYPVQIIMPGLRLFIDRQKRNRFRGLPYERIRTRLYCDPEWRHIKGHGHRHLFKVSKRVESLKLKATAKGSENLRLKMFHEQRYMELIKHPERTLISTRIEPMPEVPLHIKFNSLSKRIIRKQLRSNKKIAFNSGQERWKDGYRLPILTFAQQQEAKLGLPLERQLRDQPIMNIEPSEVRSRLSRTPKHQLPTYELELRKRLFKFLPLPGAKVLVTEQDTRPEMVNGKYLCDNFYGKEVIAAHYFMDNVVESETEKDQSYGHENEQEHEHETEAGDAENEGKRDAQEPKVRLSQEPQ